MVIANSLALLLSLTLAAWPLLSYVGGKRRHLATMRERRATVATYYTALLLCVGWIVVTEKATSAYGRSPTIELVQLIGWISIFGLGCLVLAGPFVAIDILAYAKNARTEFCPRCGYDLTGNVIGVCSECGTKVAEGPVLRPSLRQRIRTIPWGRFLPIYALAVIPFLGALGYVEVTEAYICSECCRHEYRLIHQVSLPFGGPLLFEIAGGKREGWSSSDPLTLYLDPHGTCQHNWVGLGSNGKGPTFNWRGVRVDPSINAIADEPDFGTFLSEHPDVLDRIRADLRKRRSIGGWLMEEYFEWREDGP